MNPVIPHHHNHHTIVLHVSFFLFAESLHPLTSPAYKLLSGSPSMSQFPFSWLVSLFIRFHKSGIIWHLSFSDWLTSLRSIHTVAKGKIFHFNFLV